MEPEKRGQGALWGGLILIALGVLFLLDRMNVLAFWWIFREWWPSLLILLGAVQLVTCRRRWTGPLVLIAVGGIFQIENLDLFTWWDMGTMWPLILIAAGAGILLTRLQERTWHSSSGAEARG